MTHLSASVVINTYNRAAYLRRLLPVLQGQRGVPFEVIVVNGPSTDGTAALLGEYRGQIKEVACPDRNLSRSRNLGIAAAAGAIVVFIDDDAIPGDADWLARIVAAFADPTNAQVGAVGGVVWWHDTFNREFDGGLTSDYGFQVFEREMMRHIQADGRRWMLRVPGCNCAFRRSALLAVGGFDQFYTYYMEEADICVRLARAGYTTLYLPENGVHHYSAPSDRRTGKYNRHWRVVTRSDTYYALKSGLNVLPIRLAKTLLYAPRKHYIREIVSYWRNHEISFFHWLNLMAQWLIGLVSGLRAGLFQARQLDGFRATPAPLLPFGGARNGHAAVPLQASIVINTYNRAPNLRRLLAACGHLRGATFEVLVVNGPSTDETTALLSEYEGRVKVIACPERNLSVSRNLGIAAASGQIIMFIDDDALPGDADWLARIVTTFAEDPKVGAVGGKVLHRDTDWSEFDGGATSDYGLQLFDQAQLSHLHADGYRWVKGVVGCNCAFRRNALLDIGGFDEYYTYYLDETDVCFRLARGGYTSRYLADNPVRHFRANSERRTSDYDRNWRTITRSDTYFALKNGADTLPVRAAKTLRVARAKHFYRQIIGYWRNGEISQRQWLKMMSAWGYGLLEGLRDGLRQPRRVATFAAAAPAPVPFRAPRPERPLRVALVTQRIPGQAGNGGIGRYTFDLAQGLHARGHEVHIICKDEQPLHHHSLHFTVHGLAETTYIVQDDGRGKPILNRNVTYGLAVLQKLADLYAQGVTFDLIHASNWDAELAAVVRAQVYPTALMLVSPLAQVIETEQWGINADLRACIALDKWQIASADVVCVPSMGVLGSYQKLMGITADDIAELRLAPLGIVPDAASPAVRAPGSRRTLLFVGRVERRKGVHTLFAALPALLAAHPEWECHLVGNDRAPLAAGGTMKEHFLAQHRGAAWLNRVVFHGEVDEAALTRHYRAADLFVAPSLFESFGLIYHEAMQYGVAVVGCRTGGVPEVVAHGVEGLLVAPDAPEELRAALTTLMGDDALRAQMGAAGLRRVRAAMNYRTMAARLDQVYLETIDRVGAQRAARRAWLWPHPLPLFVDAAELDKAGVWEQREVRPGDPYLFGQAGATLCFSVRGDAPIEIEVLRHEWSGILEVRLGDAAPRYFDLYKSGPLEPAHRIAIAAPGSADDTVRVTLRVHAERNPASHAADVWLRQVMVRGPASAHEAAMAHAHEEGTSL